MKRRFRVTMGLAMLAACLGMTGCVSFEIGTDLEPPQINARGLVNGHVTATGLEDWDKRILKVGVLGEAERPGEIASVDIWPLAGVGVGLVGARVRVLPLEAGVGLVGYDPKPRKPKCDDDDGDDDRDGDDPDEEDDGDSEDDDESTDAI